MFKRKDGHIPLPLETEVARRSVLARKLISLISNVLVLRQHDEVADRHVGWSREHPQARLGDVFGAQALPQSCASIDLHRVAYPPQLIQNGTRRDRADADIMRSYLAANPV